MSGSHSRRPDIDCTDRRVAERQAAVGGRDLDERVRKQHVITRLNTVYRGILILQPASQTVLVGRYLIGRPRPPKGSQLRSPPTAASPCLVRGAQ